MNELELENLKVEYEITLSQSPIVNDFIIEYHVLLDEKIGDIDGDGLPEKVSVYGDKLPNTDIIYNIIIEVSNGQSGELKADMITELNGLNPTLFLGDFTNDQVNDIFFRMDLMLNSLNSNEKGEFGIGIYSNKDTPLEPIFASDRYNIEYQFFVEYDDCYKVTIFNVMVNRIFALDISYKGKEYLSQYYYENGELIKPIQGRVLKAEKFMPIISNQKDYSYDLLAIHRIVGEKESDTIGYIENRIRWNGTRFTSVQMVASTPGTDLIASNV